MPLRPAELVLDRKCNRLALAVRMCRRSGRSVMQRSGPVLLVVAAALVAAPAAAASAGVIREFQVLSTAPAYGGATPLGAAGPYEVVTGTVHGELDPADPANAGIADLK